MKYTEATLVEDVNNNEGDLNCQLKFHEAIRKGDVQTVTCLLKNSNVDADQPDWSGAATPPILEVAISGNTELLRVLCESKCDLNARSMRGETALQICVNSRTLVPENVTLLLASGCNANIQDNLRGETALHMFVNRHIVNTRRHQQADESLKRMLMDLFHTLVQYTHIDITDHRLRTPLHMIAASKFETHRLNDLLRILLNCDPDVNIQNTRGETALIEALENNNTDIAVALVKAKTNLHLRTKYHETALHIAARKNLSEIVMILLNYDAAVNMQDLNGNTALHLAASRGYKDVVQILLENEKVQLNISNKEGLTPLHLAVESGFIYVVEILLKADSCDLTAQTKRSETALDLAQQDYRRRSQPEMAEVLSKELQRRSCGKSF